MGAYDKAPLEKIELTSPADTALPAELAKQNITPLPVDMRHALKTAELPRHHQDPFDRLIAAQCIVERCILVTADAAMQSYDVARHVVR